jgi:hypothetical protein
MVENNGGQGDENSVPADVHFSEGKSLSFLPTNVADPIDLGGLPPADGTPPGPPSEATSDDSPAAGQTSEAE